MEKITVAPQTKDFQAYSIGRIPVIEVFPATQNNQFSAKLIVNEVFPIFAKVFREGHDLVGATAVLVPPKTASKKNEICFNMYRTGYPSDCQFTTLAQVNSFTGKWSYYVEGYADIYATWKHNAEIKIANNQDIELVFADIIKIFEKWIISKDKVSKLSQTQKNIINDAVIQIKDKSLTPDQRLSVATSDKIIEIYLSNPLRELVSPSDMFSLQVDKPLSSFSAWYQIFPRSEGSKIKKDKKGNVVSVASGTFTTAAKRLPMIKDMGFDIVYLPPIHPIGKIHRKGKNNSLVANENDPGSPWAVQDHWKINDELGTVRTFKNFVKKASELNLEVALDLALQCSPDHPWVKEHPNWFNVRSDGTIAYAENPPKKYQDIYPINFDHDIEGITSEVIKLIEFWISLGVKVIRVDNPHTKPVNFWQSVIAHIKKSHHDIVFLSEAFTVRPMMKTLGLAGYDQSHCYFLWRNSKKEIEEYFTEISSGDAFWYRASFWPTTPDNLTDYLSWGGIAGHAIRAVLAAMGSTSWGIYAGYEFIENRQRVNFDGSITPEHIDSEKYEIKVRDWKNADRFGMVTLLTKLNQIRKSHIACQNIHSLKVHTTDNDNIVAFSRHIPGRFAKSGKDDTVLVVVNLDPHNAQKGTVFWDYGAINLPESFDVQDELTSKKFNLMRQTYVDLAPVLDVAHIFNVIR